MGITGGKPFLPDKNLFKKPKHFYNSTILEQIFHKSGKMLHKEYTILELFAREPWRELTFREAKRLSHNKSDNYVHASLKRFVEKKILKSKSVGNSIAYSLNNSVIALNTVGYIAEHSSTIQKGIPWKNIQKLLDKLKTAFFIAIITGSYAKGKQKETSDVDIAIICDDKQNPTAILSQIKLESELMIPEFHPYVFTQAQFYEMLTNKEENYGKEIARKNLIITGGKEYYLIVLEAIRHGFNG